MKCENLFRMELNRSQVTDFSLAMFASLIISLSKKAAAAAVSNLKMKLVRKFKFFFAHAKRETDDVETQRKVMFEYFGAIKGNALLIVAR